MLEFFLNVLALLRKEALMILKDKRGRIVLIMPLIVQTVIFGHVVTYDLNNVEYALLDEDHSWSSRKLVEQFDGSPIFHRVMTLNNSSEISDVLDNKKALMVLHIGPDFERQLNLGKTVPVQVLVDGRNSNTAGTASNYASSLVERFNSNRLQDKGMTTTKLAISCRSWFNPNLETRWGMLSALIAVLALIQVMVLAGQSVAREKEQGTFDQLLVTPFGPMTIMLGKALPPVLVGLVQSSIVFFFAMKVFSIPYAGSFLLLYLSLILFNFAVVGIGLCVSAFSSTMQQAMLYCFTLLMPMVLLSGFATPVSSMPEIFQWATLLNPVRYAVEFTQRLYLEGAGFNEIQQTLWPLLAIAVVTLGAASKLFRAKL